MNLKSSPGVYHYQSLTQEQKILSMNKSGIITRYLSLLIIQTGADDSINKSEIITRCISLSIIHTGAYDSNNESEIITCFIALSIIHT